MALVIVFVCDKCGKAKGFLKGVKTTKCPRCGKTHKTESVMRKRKTWKAIDEREAKTIIQKLNWGRMPRRSS